MTVEGSPSPVVAHCGSGVGMRRRLLDVTEGDSGVEAVPFSDAFPAIESLRESGVKTAIVSNCSRSTQAVVNRLGLLDRVDKVVLSFEVGSAKPDSEIFRHALRLLDSDAGLFVDGQTSYLDGAARVGLSTVQINPSRGPQPEATPSHPRRSDLLGRTVRACQRRVR